MDKAAYKATFHLFTVGLAYAITMLMNWGEPICFLINNKLWPAYMYSNCYNGLCYW